MKASRTYTCVFGKGKYVCKYNCKGIWQNLNSSCFWERKLGVPFPLGFLVDAFLFLPESSPQACLNNQKK